MDFKSQRALQPHAKTSIEQSNISVTLYESKSLCCYAYISWYCSTMNFLLIKTKENLMNKTKHPTETKSNGAHV